MSVKQETYKIHGVTVYASEPDRDCAIGLQGDEDFRLFVTMPKASADKLADQLRDNGYGTGVNRG